MLVGVVFTENTQMQFKGVADYRILESQDSIICAVICLPVATRSERNQILEEVAKKINQESGKEVYVSADLDVYCDLGRDNQDYETIISKVRQRNCVVVRSN